MDGFLQVTLIAAFAAGLSGGAHCAAMCGPLIGIACGSCARGRGAQWLAHALAYNAGRISAYMLAGALAGGIGAAGLALRGTAAAQQMLLAAVGVSLILLAAYMTGLRPLVQLVDRSGAALWRRIGPGAGRFLPVNTPSRAFGFGFVFGWVPCGMVYAVLVAALATADPLQGALVMAAFGLGTLPNVLAISAWFGRAVAFAKGRAARLFVAAVIAAAGVLGLLKATHPSAVSALGQCLEVPGLGAIPGVH